MAIDDDDRAAISELIALHGHLMDDGELDRLDQLFCTDVTYDLVRARSKGIGINADGTSGSVIYEDTIAREDQGWRIRSRKVMARRTPLGR